MFISSFKFPFSFKTILKLLNIENGTEVYKNEIYRFNDPLKPRFNVSAYESYQTEVLQSLEEKVLQKGMRFDFPDLIRSRRLNSDKNPSAGGQQTLLLNYIWSTTTMLSLTKGENPWISKIIMPY